MASSQAEPGDDDVMCGRGAQTNAHQGNIRFRAVVAEHQPQYVLAKKDEKEGIARSIIDTIHKRGGKFLGKNGEGEWVEVDEKKALLKTSQALREGMNVRQHSSPTLKAKKSPKSPKAAAVASPKAAPASASKPAPKAAAAAAASVPIAPRPPPPPAKVHTAKSLSSSSISATTENDALNDDDVLCGRGGGTNAYVGNIRFRKVVSDHQPRYLTCRRAEKEQIATEIVRIIQQRGGRFVSKNAAGDWVEIEDKKAILKSSQALREGMNVRGGVLKSPERASKFMAALKQDGSNNNKGKSEKAEPKPTPPSPGAVDVYHVIAQLPTMPRPQLEALARALLCNGSRDAVAVSVKAMQEAAAPADSNTALV